MEGTTAAEEVEEIEEVEGVEGMIDEDGEEEGWLPVVRDSSTRQTHATEALTCASSARAFARFT